ncbi:MAG: hypothetical protein JNL50_04920 [Phycisphaerae bacterium]|nr:hypothetical protein [Phycisphaerae bacterium]
MSCSALAGSLSGFSFGVPLGGAGGADSSGLPASGLCSPGGVVWALVGAGCRASGLFSSGVPSLGLSSLGLSSLGFAAVD